MAASLQRFKLLATQCALARSSPSRSPLPSSAAAAAGGRSPGLRLRRRRRSSSSSRSRRGGTLRRLLSRAPPSPRWADEAEAAADPDPDPEEGLLSHKLRDLLVASPPPPPPLEGGSAARRAEVGDAPPPRCGGAGAWGFGLGLRRRLLLRRAWRPMLVAIPE